MSSQMRYPHDAIQSEEGTQWQDLDNIFIDDWQSLAVCSLDGSEKPAFFIGKDFKFNIPQDVKIHSIEVRQDFHKDSSQEGIEIGPSLVELVGVDGHHRTKSAFDATVNPIERSVLFDGEDITSEQLNSPDFGIKIIFPRNDCLQSGKLFFDFIRVTVNYEEQNYILGSQGGTAYPSEFSPLEKSIGEEFVYTVLFRNTNGISKKRQEVKIAIPEGLEVVGEYYSSDETSDNKKDTIYEKDEFNSETGIWKPAVRGKGISRIRLVLKCVGEGKKELFAYNDHTGSQGHFYVKVHPEGYVHENNKYEETIVKWDSQLDDDEEYQLLNQEVVVEVNNVTMEFEKAKEKVDNIKEYCIKFVKRELKPKDHFKALNNVSFTVNKGERVGIIGFNGAGKSTLLKILSGVLRPTTGSISIEGKIAPLLELGAGFDHNYSGRENIFLNGAILGYSKEFLQSKYDEIVEFSELEEFMELPIKNYSSGMIAKLGFSVATIVEPEILILDEILSVGDVRFKKKSGDKLKSMMSSGTTVLLVSHSIDTIRSMCNRVIWLDSGRVVMDGLSADVCDAYVEAAKKASEEELSGLDLG